MTSEKFEMNGKLSTRVQSHLYDNTKYTKFCFNYCLFSGCETCFQITQGRTQIESEICTFYGSEYEASEVMVRSRIALNPDSLVFINCTARLNITINSLNPLTTFIYSQ